MFKGAAHYTRVGQCAPNLFDSTRCETAVGVQKQQDLAARPTCTVVLLNRTAYTTADDLASQARGDIRGLIGAPPIGDNDLIGASRKGALDGV